MTLKECYEKMNGNYEDARKRLMNDRLIEKFMLKFPGDNSMDMLSKAINDKNLEESFRCAHTLKGVAANLAFTDLQQTASELTEYYRHASVYEETDLYHDVEKSYQLVIQTIKQYQEEK